MRPRAVVGCALMLAAAAVHGAVPTVKIQSPQPGQFAVGEVTIEATIDSQSAIKRVEFLVDGRPVASLSSPPYRVTFDLGDDAGAHTFEVVAFNQTGEQGSELVKTIPVPLGGEVRVELQQLYVTVTRDGVRQRDLDADQFVVHDNGDRQEIVSFALGDIPFTAALMIDASSSMHGDKLEAACAGARAFVEGMQELDEAKVLVFSDRLLTASPFTRDKVVLASELGRARAQGGTALNDHLFVALKLLEERQGRRVVVLLSDGVDSHSVLSMSQVLIKAQQSQALIYWIRLARRFGAGSSNDNLGSLTSMWRNSTDYQAERRTLEQAVEDSGGYIVTVESLEEIRPVFEGILRDLREQYAIGYYPSNERNDGEWHAVRVSVRGLGDKVRAPRGYVDL